MIRSIAFGLAVALVFPAAASAAPNCSALLASEGCTCVVDAVEGAPLGELTGVEGAVQKATTLGYSPVNATTPIGDGDGLFITAGKGVLNAGPSCQSMAIGPQTSIFAKAINGCGCIKVSELKAPPPLDYLDALKLGFGVVDSASLATALQKSDAGPTSP